MLITLVLSAQAISGFASDLQNESKAKANYLLNIPLFVNFPPQLENCQTFAIGIIGDSPLIKILQQHKGRQLKNMPLEIRKIRRTSEFACCKMLFITPSEKHRLKQIIDEAKQHRILTISDMNGFIEQGGMINLVNQNKRVVFDVSISASNDSSITFSTKLLKLANHVKY